MLNYAYSVHFFKDAMLALHWSGNLTMLCYDHTFDLLLSTIIMLNCIMLSPLCYHNASTFQCSMCYAHLCYLASCAVTFFKSWLCSWQTNSHHDLLCFGYWNIEKKSIPRLALKYSFIKIFTFCPQLCHRVKILTKFTIFIIYYSKGCRP